mmetsp:Transcript_20766/g.36970  ORF Transcript_20766/g.36970 Transcript_20766/m.36970 type:complete len:230 (-) Transcript_20766:132-821(-)
MQILHIAWWFQFQFQFQCGFRRGFSVQEPKTSINYSDFRGCFFCFLSAMLCLGQPRCKCNTADTIPAIPICPQVMRGSATLENPTDTIVSATSLTSASLRSGSAQEFSSERYSLRFLAKLHRLARVQQWYEAMAGGVPSNDVRRPCVCGMQRYTKLSKGQKNKNAMFLPRSKRVLILSFFSTWSSCSRFLMLTISIRKFRHRKSLRWSTRDQNKVFIFLVVGLVGSLYL